VLRRLCLLALASFPALLAGVSPAVAQTDEGAWSQFQGDASHAGARTDAPAPPYSPTWSVRPEAASGQRLSAPVTGGGAIVVTSSTAVFAFEASTGAQRWTLERDGAPVSPAVTTIGDTRAVVYTDGRTADTAIVDAVDLEDGTSLWDAPPALEDESRTGVSVDDTQAYVADESGNVYAVGLADGSLEWTAPTAGNLAGPLAVGDGVVVAVTAASDNTRSASVVALDAATGDQRWSVTPNATATFGSLASIADGTVVVAFPDGSVVGLSADDGSEISRERIPALVSPFVSPALTGDSVVVADSNGTVHLVTPGGDPSWVFAFNEPVLRSSPVVAGDVAVVGFEDGSIGAVALDTGHMVFRSAPGPAPVSGMALTSDAVVVTRSGSGRPELVAFGTNPQGSLVDEPSPTVPVAADLAVGFGLAIATAAVIYVPGRLLARRRPVEDPAVADEDADVDDDADPNDGDEDER
jgi:outer membrane protein assembly factor BamB